MAGVSKKRTGARLTKRDVKPENRAAPPKAPELPAPPKAPEVAKALAFDAGFDKRWEKFPKPQATTDSEFWLKTGWKPEQFEGKAVLDAGCGCGRFSMIAAECGANSIFAFDASPKAVEAAKENVPSATVFRGDLLDIPLVVPESIDMAFAIGTLHHTGNTRKAFAEVAKTVKQGGELAIWVYARHIHGDPGLELVFDMFHEMTSSIPPERLYNILSRYSIPLRDYYNKRWDSLTQIVRINISDDDAECISNTFDWHCPKYRDWHSEEEVKQWFEEEGFTVDWVGPHPTTVRGTKKLKQDQQR